jgi:hypothetical protein
MQRVDRDNEYPFDRGGLHADRNGEAPAKNQGSQQRHGDSLCEGTGRSWSIAVAHWPGARF